MTPTANTAHAILMREYGPADVLSYAEVPLSPLAPDEVRIRSIAAAVNHTDLEIRAGHWPVRKPQPFPYVPGVEVVGDVDEVGNAVQEFRRGDRVITMMQGLGGVRAERCGGYAEYVTVSAATVAPVASGINDYDMAAVGLVGVTAFEGLRRIGALSGRRIVVTGAAGGIGSAATAIAHAQGASVTAVVSRSAQVDYVRSLGADEVVVSREAKPAPLLEPSSVDGVLDAVGGELFAPLVAALRPGGTLSLVGAVGGSNVSFDAFELIRPIVLTGYSSETLNGERLRNAVAALADLMVHGRIKAPAFRTMPLADAARAHALMEQGGLTGRLLLVP
jgi:NADPH2:quinone reductase